MHDTPNTVHLSNENDHPTTTTPSEQLQTDRPLLIAEQEPVVVDNDELDEFDEDDDDDDDDEMEQAFAAQQQPPVVVDQAEALRQTQRQVVDIRENLTYLTHQVYRILLALHVPACQCEVCAKRHKAQNDLILETTKSEQQQQQSVAEQSTGAVGGGGGPPQLPTSNGQMPMAGMPSPAMGVDCEALLQQLFQQPVPVASDVLHSPSVYSGRGRPPLGLSPYTSSAHINALHHHHAHQQQNGGGLGGSFVGRKSKYCSPQEKKAVAEYAAVHGASAAARKFNIPPAVAAYYHRKQFKQLLPKGRRPSFVFGEAVGSGGGPSMVAANAIHADSPGTTSGSNGDWTEMKMMEQNKSAAHLTGSPGFLRGRGRGRPKLIGDELDAELVDYMVRVKQTECRGHLTASQALQIAKEYILEKSPGLLEEHGGQIKLKLTWAMKLVARITEREREFSGEIAPSLVMPGNANKALADLLTQNLLSASNIQSIIQQQQMLGAMGDGSDVAEILQRQALALFDRKPSDSSDPGLGNGNAKLEKRDGCSDDEEMEEELKVDEQKHFQTAAAQLRPGFVTPAAF